MTNEERNRLMTRWKQYCTSGKGPFMAVDRIRRERRSRDYNLDST